jgi:hypothetical protein
MNIERTQIVSERDGTKPWYGVTVEDGSIVLVDEDDGRQSELQNKDVPIPSDSETKSIIYVVTQDGRFLELTADTEENPAPRAHIGRYNPETQTLDLIEFVEP